MKIQIKIKDNIKTRTTWGFDPVTRVVKSKKLYSRKKYRVSKELKEY